MSYVEFEHFPKAPKGAEKVFRLEPDEFSAVINFPLTSDGNGIKVKFGNVKVSQIPVNCNIATTGHKLQGMSLDNLVVNSWTWDYKFENWVYVVLLRVRKRAGFGLNKKLDLKREFKVPEKL